MSASRPLTCSSGHGEGWHADNASANSMTGWEPIVVKPLIILRQIKTVETERDALLRPSEEGTQRLGRC